MKNKKNISIYQKMYEANKNFPNDIAIEYYGKKITFKEFFEKIDIYANAFAELGIEDGKKVTVSLFSTPEFMYTFYALNKLGAVATMVSPKYLARNTKRYMEGTESNTLITLENFLPFLAPGLLKTDTKNIIVTSIGDSAPTIVKGIVGLKAHKAKLKESEKVIAKDINVLRTKEFIKLGGARKTSLPAVTYEKNKEASIMYTSGTTGEPKGVILTNDAINRMCDDYIPAGLEVFRGERNVIVTPPFHATMLVHCYVASTVYGGTNILQPVYNKLTFPKDVKKLKPDIVFAPVGHWSAFLKSDLKSGDLKYIRLPFCGGEPVQLGLIEKIDEKLDELGCETNVMVGYGASELGPMTFLSHMPDKNMTLNSPGKALPGVEARIINPDTKEEVGPNEYGILQVKTTHGMKGYYKNEEATKAYYTEDGYAQPLDLASVDENGNYTVYGRAKEGMFEQTVANCMLKEHISTLPSIYECESTSLPINNNEKEITVIHAVINPKYKGQELEVVKQIEKQIINTMGKDAKLPEGYKMIDEFGTDNVSDKRDLGALKKDRADYYKPINGEIFAVDFPENSEPIYKKIEETAKEKSKADSKRN